MSKRVSSSQFKVPYLLKQHIEDFADQLLGQWVEEHPEAESLPVPIEEILEIGLGLDFEICDLQAELGHEDVLGGIWFGNKLIKVDQTLDPSSNSRMLGRYRFTLAHEVGHWHLHRKHLMTDPSALSLFEENGKPAFVCRSSEKPPEEWQADRFAACLLMPRRLVFDSWERWRGNPDSASFAELGIEEHDTDGLKAFCRPMADKFEVSAQAMLIRLQDLKFLVKEKEPQLF